MLCDDKIDEYTDKDKWMIDQVNEKRKWLMDFDEKGWLDNSRTRLA